MELQNRATLNAILRCCCAEHICNLRDADGRLTIGSKVKLLDMYFAG